MNDLTTKEIERGLEIAIGNVGNILIRLAITNGVIELLSRLEQGERAIEELKMAKETLPSPLLPIQRLFNDDIPETPDKIDTDTLEDINAGLTRREGNEESRSRANMARLGLPHQELKT